MYINSGYLNNSRIDFMDKSKPLIVGSSGTYHLFTRFKLPTYRPKGRLDFQLIYIASGKAHFYFQEDREEIVSAGHMVLYRPKEMQKYVYYAEDHPEVYWVHFTGHQVKQILRKYGLPVSDHVFYAGISLDYQTVFRKMIQELQRCRPNYEEMLTLLLQEIFILIGRQTDCGKTLNNYMRNEMEQAACYFHEHYNENISIEHYAALRHMSTCWFIRNFKQYNGMTPLNYILNVRIAQAKQLLETTDYNITEISYIIGYDNPLYFSRLFKKQIGLSPSEYRKQLPNNIIT